MKKFQIFLLCVLFSVVLGWAQDGLDENSSPEDDSAAVVEDDSASSDDVEKNSDEFAPKAVAKKDDESNAEEKGDEGVVEEYDDEEDDAEEEVVYKKSKKTKKGKVAKKSKKSKKVKKSKKKKKVKKSKTSEIAYSKERNRPARRGGMRFGFDMAASAYVYDEEAYTNVWGGFGLGMSFGYFFPKYVAVLSDLNFDIETEMSDLSSSSTSMLFSLDFPIAIRYVINRRLWTELGVHYHISMFYFRVSEDYWGDMETTSGSNFDINYDSFTVGFGFSWGRCNLGFYAGVDRSDGVVIGMKLILWGRNAN